MLKFDLRARTALIATALALSACSSDGSVALGAGAGVGGAGAGGGGAAGSGGGASGGGGGPLASAGNVGNLLTQVGQGAGEITGSEAIAPVRDVVDPLARVSLGDATTLGGTGSDSSALGLSVGSPTQNQGQVATVGVLSNGQVATLNANGAGDTNVLGLQADNEQVIGGADNALSVNALSDNAEQGSAGTVTLLTNAQIANVELNNPQGAGQNGGLRNNTLNGVTNTLNSLTGGQ